MIVELYHVTYDGRLEGIAQHGLLPEVTGVFEATGYGEHSRNRIFLTEEDGIRYWYSKLEDHAEHWSENLYEDGMVPVVLRVRVEEDDLRDDELGTRDARADAYYVTTPISNDDIEVWNGEDWVGTEDGVDAELALSWFDDSEEDDEDYEGYWQFKLYDNTLREPDVDRAWYDDEEE